MKRIATLACLLAVSGTVMAQGQGGTDDARAAALVRAVAGHLKEMKAYSFEFTSVSLTTADGMRTEYTSTYGASVQRPRNVALRFQSGMASPTIVSNASERSLYLPFGNAYTIGPAPESTDDLIPREDDGAMAMAFFSQLHCPGLLTTISGEPDKLLEPIAAHAELKGQEQINGVQAYHVSSDVDGSKVEMWISTGEPAVLVRAESPTDPGLAQMGGFYKNLKVLTRTDFANWKAVASFPEGTFSFTPPAGARKADSLEDAATPSMGEQPQEKPHVAGLVPGDKAPDFTLDLVEGGTITMAELAKKNKVIVLDFWATWCPPCRQGLPVLDEISKGYKPEELEVYAIDLREDAGTIRKFVKSTGLGLTIAMDKDGAVAEKYGVEGIPQTVLIGKDGTVQVVHVGFSPNMKTEIKGQIDALVAGKKLAEGEAPNVPDAPAAAAGDGRLTQVWTARGRFEGLAADRAGATLYAASGRGVTAFNFKGEKLREIPVKAERGTLRLGNLAGDAAPEFVLFGGWGQTVEAFDGTGKKLWSYPTDGGVDDVAIADLNGDGVSEVLVGFNGDGGLRSVGADGKLRWKYTGIGNVWHVTTGTREGQPVVITTSARGQVHLFGADGKKIRDLTVPMYANMVRAGRADSTGSMILVGGAEMSGRGERVARLDINGNVKWNVKLPEGEDNVDCMSICETEPVAAVGGRSGTIYLMSLENGQVLGSVKAKAMFPEATFFSDGQSGKTMLGVVTETGVAAYSVRGG